MLTATVCKAPDSACCHLPGEANNLIISEENEQNRHRSFAQFCGMR